MNNRIFIVLGSALLLFAGCRPQTILVEKLEFEKPLVKLFVGEQQEISLNAYPSNATNLDELTVFNSDPSVAEFQDGLLTAKKGGTTKLIATCGSAQATAQVSVYYGWFTKGGKKYGVDEARGHKYLYGTSTAQEIDITLTFNEENGQDQQHFWCWIPCDRLGETIDFIQDMSGCLISVWKNENEDGYSIPYYDWDAGCPKVVLADWGDTDATLTKGLLKVVSLGFDRYSVSADFALSNGYTFTADWEGPATMQQQ